MQTNTMITEWHVTGERGQMLIPRGDSKELLASPILTETGFEWLYARGLHQRATGIIILFLFVALRTALQHWCNNRTCKIFHEFVRFSQTVMVHGVKPHSLSSL